jgi:hypothetical protein
LSSATIYDLAAVLRQVEIELCPSHTEFCVLSHSHNRDSASKPLAFDSAPSIVLVRSLPPFPLYSLAGAVNGDIGGGKDCSEDRGNVGAARIGVGV